MESRDVAAQILQLLVRWAVVEHREDSVRTGNQAMLAQPACPKVGLLGSHFQDSYAEKQGQSCSRSISRNLAYIVQYLSSQVRSNHVDKSQHFQLRLSFAKDELAHAHIFLARAGSSEGQL